MKILKTLTLVLIVCGLATSCFEDNDDNGILSSEINDFVWKGMNFWYLYKDNVPDLANDRFSSDEEYGTYLNTFSEPEELFESLIYQRPTVDRFSWIVDDYIALEQLLNGTTVSNGLKFYSFPPPGNSSDRILAIRQVLVNSVSDNQNLQRGQYINQIDDITLTVDNINPLLSQDTYTLHFADYNDNGTPETGDDTFTSNGATTTLTKVPFTANPIHRAEIINVDGENLGYLMYNGFNASTTDLNNVFGSFKSSGVTNLVLDLRYNPGGFISNAILLSSMITGQFTGDIFSTEQYNNEIQAILEADNPEFLINRFINNDDGMSLNSLNLGKVYVLTTSGSASASELVINSLKPYIQVVQIGTTTAGKYQGSRTVYDSPDFGRQGANPNHTYGLQPLILKSLNVNGVTDYFDGLAPDNDNMLAENVLNLGVLGNVNEPLLADAISDILGSGRSSNQKENTVESIKIDKDLESFPNGMISDKEIPKEIINRIQYDQ